jgi:hypothetical protein
MYISFILMKPTFEPFAPGPGPRTRVEIKLLNMIVTVNSGCQSLSELKLGAYPVSDRDLVLALFGTEAVGP